MTSPQGYYNNVIAVQHLQRIASCWQTILNAPTLISDEHQLLNVPLDLPNQRVVNLDVVRTRMHLLSPELAILLEKGLTYFCKRNGVLYKQGINEIMVPFMAWRRSPSVSVAAAYNCFEAFFRRYLLNLYFDEEFNSLQLLFRLITIILKYHDPSLARFLFENDITPELYSTAWFMTLFANKLSIELLYLFWQVYIVEDDEYFIYYVIVGLLLYNKYRLLQTKESELPQFITQLSFQTPQQLSGVLKIALLVRKCTPKSLFLLCKQKKVFDRCQDYKSIRTMLNNIENINLFLILPQQIVDSIYGSAEVCASINCKDRSCYFCRISEHIDSSRYQHFVEDDPWLARTLELSNDIRSLQRVRKFVVLDIRLNKDRILIDSELIDISQPPEAIEEQFLANFLEKRGKIHFVFLFTKFRFDSLDKCEPAELAFCKKFIEILYSAGFQFMGILEGGFYQLEKAIRCQMLRNDGAKGKIKSGVKGSTTELMSKLPHSSGLLKSMENIVPASSSEYYLNNGISNPVRLSMLPGILFRLERLTTASKLIMSESHVLLVTQRYCVIFRNNQLLKNILQYLSNSKSLVQYFLSGLKAEHSDETLELESVFFTKDLERLSTKETVPGLLLLYFRVFYLKEEPNGYSRHIAALSSRHALAYIQSLPDRQCHQLYDEVEGCQHKLAKKKIMCEPSQLASCVDYIKSSFVVTARDYKQFKKASNLQHSPSA